ncbi:MAG: hypothetical protein M0Z66_03045 [Thermaerobacter sp.]|nr:hypothetical protein [Thermaerobacter sp.]
MLRAIKSRVQFSAEWWCIAGGSILVLESVAGGFGFSGTPALIVGAVSAALMAIGVAQMAYIEFSGSVG